DLQALDLEATEDLGLNQIGNALGILGGRGGFLELIGHGLGAGQRGGIGFGDSVMFDQTLALGLRKLRKLRGDLFAPCFINHKREEVGLREVAVIVGLFLGAHAVGLALGRIVEARLLGDAAT